MKKVFVVLDGETEERFVRPVLYPHFILMGIHLEPEQWITGRKTGGKGGGSSFDLIENHIKRRVGRYKKDESVFITTMVDLYAFPRGGHTVYDREVAAATGGAAKKRCWSGKWQNVWTSEDSSLTYNFMNLNRFYFPISRSWPFSIRIG